MNTKIFEMLIRRTGLRRDSKAEIIQLNRNEKAFVDEDKESIELAEAIFEENNMFHFRKPGPAMDYILHKLINDRKLFEEMKDRGTSIIRLFSLLSMYHGRLNCCVIRKGGCITECGILDYAGTYPELVPLEDFILIEPCSYLEYTVLDNDNIRNRLARDLTEDKTKLDIFLNGILATKNSDLVLSCINKIEVLNEEDRYFVNRLQKNNMLDYILNKDDTTLAKSTLKELLKLSILQEGESTKLESPQASSVNVSKAQQHCSI
ncbi:hypothetical protein ACT91P_02310 [Wolbachia pipientis]|uniref:hypothetical protein n=2 Tax=Wolbachieae TaxID=952 RepID=UPI00004CA3CD|nr:MULTISPECIES: hypothetical protein [Wolbachia]MDX5498231.1 hypothetical protein [Wolbachia endosymbiont of Lasioglossum nitidulum]MDX5510452.1 hypothetical protein [Wolbachia endosymbiont of Lasioglossum morio]MDX5543652.1 hypothetical protein [Wolbachia endosymbiont of Andrena apicata]MDX5596597.1 hypothetical protein [Wolbachia endosymbiont of Andrena labialis]POG51425.1 hypothetical protein BJU59_05610 [Wolbachia sp. wRi_2]